MYFSFWCYKLQLEKRPRWSFYRLLPSPTPLFSIWCWGRALCLVQWTSSAAKLDWYRRGRPVPMLDVCLCAGEGQTRQAPFPPFYQTVLIYSTICFPSARDDAGDMWLGALRQKLACTRPAMCLPPSDAAVSSKFFAAASSQYGREQAWAGLCRRHKETKYGKEGKKGREMGWGACERTVGRKDRQTDRWAE